MPATYLDFVRMLKRYSGRIFVPLWNPLSLNPPSNQRQLYDHKADTMDLSKLNIVNVSAIILHPPILSRMPGDRITNRSGFKPTAIVKRQMGKRVPVLYQPSSDNDGEISQTPSVLIIERQKIWEQGRCVRC
jgi:hypothetical protein